MLTKFDLSNTRKISEREEMCATSPANGWSMTATAKTREKAIGPAGNYWKCNTIDNPCPTSKHRLIIFVKKGEGGRR